jgi:hypothetical protein
VGVCNMWKTARPTPTESNKFSRWLFQVESHSYRAWRWGVLSECNSRSGLHLE